MMFLASKILSALEQFREGGKTASALKRIRSENPTCNIENCSITNVRLGRYSTILDGASVNNSQLDDYSYVSYGSHINNARVGKFCSIGPNVQIGLAPHPMRDYVSTYPAFYSKRNPGCALLFRTDSIFDDRIPETTLGNDIWIGADVIIPGGISVGTGAVIAAGAVVVKDVLPYAVVGGNPAAMIRYRFSGEEIEALLKSAWWNWPIEEIKKQVGIFSNIKTFLNFIQK